MLGVRSRWQRGGRDAAEEAFQIFRGLVASSLKNFPHEQVLKAIIETDAVAVTCSSVSCALQIAKRLYLTAFVQTARDREKRVWFRGAVIPCENNEELRKTINFKPPLEQVRLVLYEPELLDAIAVEKSGFRGMRMLVQKALVTKEVTKEFCIPIEKLNCITLKKLRNSLYPARVAGEYVDYLWMATPDADELVKLERIMALRLRAASHDPDEFIQAAATQLVFHETSAIIGSLRTRLKYQRRKKKSPEAASKEVVL